MAYNYYNPYQNQYMSQMQIPQVPQAPQIATQVQQPQQSTGSPIWVQGEAGAKSYLVAPGATVMLMDSETQRFYLKSSDASGMPLPLRVFEYTEKTAKTAAEASPMSSAVDLSGYATKAELDAFRDEINGLLQNAAKAPAKVAKGTVKADE